VTYHGTLAEHHGTYTVFWWNYCFAVPCIDGCDGFTYLLKPLDPATVNLQDGQGLVAHSVYITLTQPPDIGDTPQDERQERT
jgi:hypothetical protein